MREIKFKAWFDDGKTQAMFFVGDAYGTKHPLDCVRYAQEGQPVTLLQFTGLHDVNGVEIYEGDIVTDKYNKRPLEVKFYADTNEIYHCGGCCGDSFDGSGFAALSDNRKNIHLSECIVIGNIHENPELLK